jgi:hypothetical protein
MKPRINLTSSPYAFRANVSDKLNKSNNYEMENLTINGNVGIGTSNPQNTLNIKGDLNVTGKSYLGSFEIQDELKVGDINISGTSNKIGIGISNPTSSLYINNSNTPQAVIKNEFGNTRVDIDSNSGSLSQIIFSEASNIKWAFRKDVDGKIKIIDLNAIGQPTRFLIENSTGNVGIGTTNPNSTLHVNGDLDFNNLSNRRFVFEGDSLTAYTTYPASTWTLNLSNDFAFFGAGKSYNVAKGGARAYQMNDEYDTQVAPYKPTKPSDDCYFFIWGGGNDLNGDDATAEHVYGNLTELWAKARDDGFKVVAFTITYASVLDDDGTKEANRSLLNEYILSNSSAYDYLIRPELLFPDYTDTTYYMPGGVHLNSFGSYTLSKHIGRTLFSSPYSEVLYKDGNIGIGTAHPSSNLEIAGNFKIRNNGGTSLAVIEGDGNNNAYVRFRNDSTTKFQAGYVPGTNTFSIIDSVSGNIPFAIFSGTTSNGDLVLKNGNVGIGVNNPPEKLSVDGNAVITGNLWVDGQQMNVPDFVFEKDYKIMSLEDLKIYVDKNKHLPYVKSSKEIEESGINIVEDRNNILEAVENIFIHLFKLNEKIKEQEKEINLMKQSLCNLGETQWC